MLQLLEYLQEVQMQIIFEQNHQLLTMIVLPISPCCHRCHLFLWQHIYLFIFGAQGSKAKHLRVFQCANRVFLSYCKIHILCWLFDPLYFLSSQLNNDSARNMCWPTPPDLPKQGNNIAVIEDINFKNAVIKYYQNVHGIFIF